MTQHVYHWKHGWIPLDHTAALEKARGNATLAAQMLNDAHSGGTRDRLEFRLGLPDGRQNFVTAHINGERVGEMSWHETDKHITWTSVYDVSNRRKGIASGMLQKALEHDPTITHNTGGGDGLTADGKAFADSRPIKRNSYQPTQPTSSNALNLDKIPDATLLADIKKYRATAPNSPTLKAMLREAYHRGLDTRDSR